MRRIAVINQKGGVGKTTTCANLGAALALEGRTVVLFDLDPQANLSLHLDHNVALADDTLYGVLSGKREIAQVLRPTRTPRMSLAPAHIDLSGAELELAGAMGREHILRDALERWTEELARSRAALPDFLLFDCPPSLGLLSINGLVASEEALIALQTEFFALQGMTKLLEVLQLLRRRLNPKLELLGILPSLYDARLKLAREVLAEIREHFPGRVFARPIAKCVKLAECSSFGQTIYEYAPESSAAVDYRALAREILGAPDATTAGESPVTVVVPAARPNARPSSTRASSPKPSSPSPGTPNPGLGAPTQKNAGAPGQRTSAAPDSPQAKSYGVPGTAGAPGAVQARARVHRDPFAAPELD